MRKETISLNRKEQQRLMVLNQVERGDLTGKQAAALMGLCLRQMRRLLAAYRKEGATALAHGNRGCRPVHALSGETRKQVIALAQGRYAGFNHHHLTELLAEMEGLVLSRSSVWRILTAAGLRSPRQRRSPKHRCRRERYPQEGMLLQIDGSHHDWLEGRGPYLTLVGAIDDATGIVPHALFREQEDAQGYFMLLGEVIQSKGIPLAVYSDQHGIFQRSAKEPESLMEQLEGKRQPTQFGRALMDLCIQPIFALSPQAKGRIERLWGTFQDRLVSELRLAGASTIDDANRVLWNFLPRFNAQFSVPPAQPGSAYRRLPTGLCLESVLCFKYQRTVAADNTIRFNGQVIQLLPGWDRRSYAHARVEVQERLDGSLVAQYQGKTITSRPAPPHPVTLRARKGARGTCTTPLEIIVAEVDHKAIGTLGGSKSGVGLSQEKSPMNQGQKLAYKPGTNHPWRKPLLVTKSQNR